MAASANQQVQNILQNQTIQQNQSIDFYQTIDGVPTADWLHKQKPKLDVALAEKRYAQLDALSVANGTAPGGPQFVGPPQTVFAITFGCFTRFPGAWAHYERCVVVFAQRH